MLCYLSKIFSFRFKTVFHSDTDPAGAAAASAAASDATTAEAVVKTKAAAAKAAAELPSKLF